MKDRILHIWITISENGISNHLSVSEKKRIKVINRVLFLNALLAFTFLFVDIVNRSYEAAVISSIAFFMSPFLFFLIRKRYYQTVKWVIILFFILFISAISILTGRGSGMILYFIPGILFPTIIFDKNKTILLTSSLIIVVSIAAFIINEVYEPQVIINPKELSFYYISSIIGCTVLTLLIIRYFKSTNTEYEKIIIANTKKNMDLTRSMMEQDKLVTIGEISAGIAHDLSTPLGTIRVGADNINFILSRLFNGSISDFTEDELTSIFNHVDKNRIEMYVGGLQMRQEKEEMLEFLNKSVDGENPKLLNELCDLLVKCRFNPTHGKEILKIVSKPLAKEYLEILNQLQMAMAQLETIRKSSDKAVGVVQDMRAFIKGESVLEPKKINLRENISTVLGVFNYEISQNVNLVFEVDSSIELMGYDIKLFQLWSNIVKNGLEAMSGQKDRYLGIFTEIKANQLNVIFENNGPKIPDDIVDIIFQKFYSTKKNRSGSGLGLSIVKNVLEDHRADIKVESKETLTKFIITFEI